MPTSRQRKILNINLARSSRLDTGDFDLVEVYSLYTVTTEDGETLELNQRQEVALTLEETTRLKNFLIGLRGRL